MLESASVSVLLPDEPSRRALVTQARYWSRWARNIAKEPSTGTLAYQIPPSHKGSNPADFKTGGQKQNKFLLQSRMKFFVHASDIFYPSSPLMLTGDLNHEETPAFQVPN